MAGVMDILIKASVNLKTQEAVKNMDFYGTQSVEVAFQHLVVVFVLQLVPQACQILECHAKRFTMEGE